MVEQLLEKETTKLGRSCSWYRIFYFGDKQVENIHFFKNGKIIFSQHRWLEKYSYIYHDMLHLEDVAESMEIINPQKKLKVDLNMKKNFYVKNNNPQGYETNPVYDLYLYVDGVDIKAEELKLETLEYSNEEYSTVLNIQYYTFWVKGMAEIVTTAKVVDRRIDYTDFYNQAEELAKEWKEKFHISNISGYDLRKILKEYSIVKKEVNANV